MFIPQLSAEYFLCNMSGRTRVLKFLLVRQDAAPLDIKHLMMKRLTKYDSQVCENWGHSLGFTNIRLRNRIENRTTRLSSAKAHASLAELANKVSQA